jgi:hypothetical protein
MEDKISAASLTIKPSHPWVVSAPFDLLFIANVCWPLLLLPGFSSETSTVVDFWQVYYLTLPHRWLTLFLVFVDKDRRADRTWLLVSMALVSAAVVAGAYWGSGAFLCLGLVDYVWNGWHFASQHSGVLRIYSKKVDGGFEWLERWGLRGFVFYVIVRTSSSILWKLENDSTAIAIASAFDWIVLAIPIAILAANLRGWHTQRLPKLIYMFSVLSLYTGYLLASHFHWSRFILCIATAAALFHAIEYIAIVSHYADRRQRVGSQGLMRAIAGQWMLVLTVFVICLGTLGVWASSPTFGYETIWQGFNLWAAFTHYALDGVIWRLRRPETAMALGAA